MGGGRSVVLADPEDTVCHSTGGGMFVIGDAVAVSKGNADLGQNVD